MRARSIGCTAASGTRASFEMWKIFPDVHSEFFNLNGLAHKMVFDADYSFSDLQPGPRERPAVQRIRRQRAGTVPPAAAGQHLGRHAPAAVRPAILRRPFGAAASVTAPYNELVDNMNVLRLGWRHRLQTKVGPVNAPRIKNWMTLDLETSFFPDYNRDNFGEPFGLYAGRYNWYVGDRTTLTAGTLFDTFTNPERLWNSGSSSQRSTRGSVYVGIRDIQGGSLLHQRNPDRQLQLRDEPQVDFVGRHRLRPGRTSEPRPDRADHARRRRLPDAFRNARSIPPRTTSESPFRSSRGLRPFTGNSAAAGNNTQLGSLLYGTPGMGLGPGR